MLEEIHKEEPSYKERVLELIVLALDQHTRDGDSAVKCCAS